MGVGWLGLGGAGGRGAGRGAPLPWVGACTRARPAATRYHLQPAPRCAAFICHCPCAAQPPPCKPVDASALVSDNVGTMGSTMADDGEDGAVRGPAAVHVVSTGALLSSSVLSGAPAGLCSGGLHSALRWEKQPPARSCLRCPVAATWHQSLPPCATACRRCCTTRSHSSSSTWVSRAARLHCSPAGSRCMGGSHLLIPRAKAAACSSLPPCWPSPCRHAGVRGRRPGADRGGHRAAC